MKNRIVIDESSVRVMDSPFTYTHIDKFRMTLTGEGDDTRMDCAFEITTGEWIGDGHIELMIDIKDVPDRFLRGRESIVDVSSPFLGSEDPVTVKVSRPYVNRYQIVKMFIEGLSSDHSIGKISAPPRKTVEMIDRQVDVTMDGLIGTRGVLRFNMDLESTRRVVSLSDLSVDVRRLRGGLNPINLDISMDRIGDIAISGVKKMPIDITVDKLRLWTDEIIDSTTVPGSVTLKSTINIREDLDTLEPGYDYRISCPDVVIQY